jgi:peptidoglycan hydrolase CwlO-like protein
MTWRKCSTHPDVDGETMWSCPDCLVELRHLVIQFEYKLEQAEQAEKRMQSQIDYLERKVDRMQREIDSLSNDVSDLERKL